MRRTVRAPAALAAAATVILGGFVAAAPAQAAAACPTIATAGGAPTPAPQPYVNWSGCDLTGANFAAADLRYANLTGATLTGANLTGAQLYATNFYKASAARTTWTDANAPLVVLRDTDLTGATFTRTVMYIALMDGADLDGATFTGADVRNSALDQASMITASVRSSTFHASTVSGVSLKYATVDGSDFSDTALGLTRFSGSTITNTNFDRSRGAELIWSDTGTDAVTTSSNTWVDALCGDSWLSTMHEAGDCFRPRDTTAPFSGWYATVTGPGTGVDHWYTGPVTINWNWYDEGAIDPAKCTLRTPVTATGTATATCTDTAGNTGTGSYLVRIDTAKPTAAVNLSTLNSDGAQYPKCTGADTGGSGLVSCTIATTASSDRNYRYAVATAKDKAGNTTTTAKVRYRSTTVAAWKSVPSTKTHGYRFTVYVTAKNAKGYLVNVSPVRAFKPVKVTSTGSGPANTTWGSYFTKVSTGTYKLTLTAPSTRGYYRYAVRVGNATITKVIRIT